MKIKVLDRATLGFDLDLACLNKYGEVEVYDNSDGAQVLERIKDAEIVIINKIKITKAVIENGVNLKLICVFATGYDNIDVNAAKEHGISVCNVPAYSTDSVALCTVSNVLYLYTHLGEYNSFVKSGEYTREGKANRLTPVYHEMNGIKWGIVGYGNIGKRVAGIAEALGAEILVNKLTPIDGVRCVDIETICRECDVITLHCPLNENTRGLINSYRLSLMKKSVVLVNEARGAVTDEAAITDAILNVRIGAFGSDVYSVEPFPQDHPFNKIKELPNVCLTPHCAWGAYESRVRALNIICNNIESFMSGKILNRVDI